MLPAGQSSKHEPMAFELNTEKLDIPFLFELYEGAFANASAYVILTSQDVEQNFISTPLGHC